jgi:hypothetical protein
MESHMTYLYVNDQEIKNESGNAISVRVFSNGAFVNTANPLPVTLGADTITITGNVNVSTVVQVNSTPENPVHNHITEVGTSGILNVPYMPVGGDVSIFNSNGAHITNTSPLPVSGNVSVTGTITTVPDLSVGSFYGEPYAIPITPVIQLDGRYGVSVFDTQTYTNGGGTIGSDNGPYTASCTSTVGSYALIRSRRFNTYKAGQSHLARLFAKFDSPYAGTSQRIGVQNQENGYWVGYDGTKFGFLHTHGGRADIHRVTISSYTGTQLVTLTLNGVTYSTTIQTGETTNQAAYKISQINFGGVWLATQRDNTVELLHAGNVTLNGTFSVVGAGTFSGSISQLQAGQAATNEWYYAGTAQEVANPDPLDPNPPVWVAPSWLVPTNYQQYQFKYNWAGVNLFALNPDTGQYVLIHQHIHVNSSTLDISNPAFKIAILALNTGGSTPVTIRTATMMMAIEGIEARNNYTGGGSSSKSSLTNDIIHQVMSIQNPYVYNGAINTKELKLEDLSVAAQCNDPSEVLIFFDTPLLTGTEDFQTRDTQPVTLSTTSGTISANSFPIITFIAGTTGSVTQYDLEPYRVVVPPGSIVTVGIRSTAAINKVAAAITWYND